MCLMHPILDPEIQIRTMPGYSLACVPLDHYKTLENLAEVSRKTLSQVMAQIIDMAITEITKQVTWELAEQQEQLQDEMALKLAPLK